MKGVGDGKAKSDGVHGNKSSTPSVGRGEGDIRARVPTSVPAPLGKTGRAGRNGKDRRTTPVFIRLSTPDKHHLGYHDVADVYDGLKKIYSCPCRTGPNPYHPHTREPWQDVYAMILCGRFRYNVVASHYRFGKCLLLNEGGEISTINPNNNHGGKHIAKEIFVHCGGLRSINPKWPGSKGCITIDPDYSDKYFSFFPWNASGIIVLDEDAEYTLTEGVFL